MSSTYNGLASNIAIGSGFSITEPADGDALNAASHNVSVSKLADAVEYFRLPPARSSATAGAGQAVALGGAIYQDCVVRGWGYYTVSGGVITLVRGVNQATPSYSGVGAYIIGLQTANLNYAAGVVMPYHSAPIVVVASSAPGANSLAVKFYNMSSTLTDPLGFLVMFSGG